MAEDQYNEDDFSYERDIAPMNRRYFERVQSLGLSAGPSASLLRQQRASSDALFERESKIRQIEAERQTSLLQREKAFLDLENGRRKTQQELVQMEQLRPIQEVLSNINNNAPPQQREPLIRQFGINYAGAIESNPAAKYAYENAMKDAKPVEDKDAITVGQLVEEGVSLSSFKKLADAGGVDFNQLRTDTKLSPIGAAFLLEESSKSKAQLEADRRRLEKEEEDQKQRVSFLMKGIDDVKLMQDKLTGKTLDQFEDPTDDPVLTTVVATFGSPEQQTQFTKGTATQKLNIAKQVRTQWALGGLKPAAPIPSATFLFE